MELKGLKDYLQSEKLPQGFLVSIKGEVEEYRKQLAKKGSSASISLVGDLELTLSKKDLVKLCDHFLNGIINEYYLQYFADAILLSDRIRLNDDRNYELIELMTDPEVNEVELNAKFISELKHRLV